MTLAEWEAQLRGLREDLGPLRTMRMKRWRTFVGQRNLVGLPLTDEFEDWVALYEIDVSPNSRPSVVFPVRSGGHAQQIPQGAEVEVAGTPAPGEAVVVVHGDVELWPAYPATSTRSRRYRWDRLGRDGGSDETAATT